MNFAALAILAVTLGAVRAADADAPSRPMSEIAALVDAASPGDVVLVPPGTYEGNLVLRKAVTLDGAGHAILDGQDKGTVVDVVADGATIRGFIVRNSGKDVTSESAGIRATAARVRIEANIVEDTLFGIDLRESPDAVICDNRVIGKDLEQSRRGDGIRLWWSHGALVENNVVRRSRDMVFWYSENLRVTGNRVSDSRYGLHFMYSHDTALEANELAGNSVGVYLMYSNRISLTRNHMRNNRGASGYGIGLKDCDDIAIIDNEVIANRVGVYIDNSPSSLGSTGLFDSNLIAYNEIGLLATPNTHDNVFTRNAFVENEEPAATHGRGRLAGNSFAGERDGNYWSDYAGFDLDGDGIGDIEYAPRSLFGALLVREPNLRLFVHSPAQRAVEFTARALPELLPEPVFVDPAPLTAVPFARPVTRSGTSIGMGALGAALSIVAGAVIVLFGREPRLSQRALAQQAGVRT